MIRIGSSCALSPSMAIGKVVELRTYLDGYNNQNFINTINHCITNQIYLIITACTHDGKTGHYPTDNEWKSFIENICNILISNGGTKLNCRISLVNEPCKFMTREAYANLINIAYKVINKRFSVGAGNEEFTLAESKGNMYEYILANCNMDILDIHIQTSCTQELECIKWTNYAYNLGKQYGKPVDCTEANYVDPTIQYPTLLMQLSNAERIGCPNFCWVFPWLDKKAFPFNVSKWERLCLIVNGIFRQGAEAIYNDLMNLTNIKAPNPNIPIERTNDGMILPSTKLGSTGYLTQWVEEVLIILGYGIADVDGIFSASDVTELKEFQLYLKTKYQDLPITIDGICGRQGYFYLNDEIPDSILRDKYWRKLNCYASPVK